MEADSIDSCVTDPPYELGFMGKAWDRSGIAYNVDLWREVLRVLKPGAHLLAFGGTRTYHRMVCAIEDAGFEIRDQIQWIYGSGFPKSLDVSKAIDKEAGVQREVVGVGKYAARRVRPSKETSNPEAQYRMGIGHSLTAATTESAKKWEGWGTALKPAHEPIVLARKPLEKGLTVAQNVLKWGTGALNIDGCRISTEEMLNGGAYAENGSRRVSQSLSPTGMNRPGATAGSFVQPSGRFPANVIHDGSGEVLAHFPNSSSGQPMGIKAGGQGNAFGYFNGGIPVTGFGDEGSAARFFYCAKASNQDRNEGLGDIQLRAAGTLNMRTDPHSVRNGMSTSPRANHHPTVKPTELMTYLCKLITPPNGLILDPFLGSGSTAKAAFLSGFRCVGIELNAEYAEIAEARVRGSVGPLFHLMEDAA
jgi:hypothetical protein